MERLRVVVVSDKAGVADRPGVKTAIELDDVFQVSLLSRVKIFRINQEIVPQNPNIVFAIAALGHPEESNEFRGFIEKLRRKLPEAIIIIQTPALTHPQRQQFFEAGASAWVDKTVPYALLSQALKRIATDHIKLS